MTHLQQKIFALFGAVSIGLGGALAQDSGALLDALVRKGILDDQEAEEIRADLVRDSQVIPAQAYAGGKSTDKLSVGVRLQAQYANLGTDIETGSDPSATNHFFLRRVYLTTKASLGANWNAVLTYDFAASGYDDAYLQWKGLENSFDFGLRKVNVVYEERASSGNIKAIERSSVTRYFVESNNGRRLGAASYRVGAFMDGKKGHFVYSAAVTNPERTEDFAGASSAGTGANNSIAYWGNVGFTDTIEGGSYIFGVGAGFLPDQGGNGTANLGKGYGLEIYSAYTDITKGRFGLMAEYLTASVEGGAAGVPVRDAAPWGFYVQPSFLVTEKLEAVFRFAFLDSDGRGVNISDGVRSAPSGGTMDKLTELYLGANYYVKGNDLKFQLGYVYGKTEDTVTGASAEAEAQGVRSQFQVQF